MEKNYWGYHLILNMSDCNPQKIRSEIHIRDFVVQLCDLIEMKRFGGPIVVHFGDSEEVSGYSLVQLIETSNVCGHFVNKTNDVYLDIFSCKQFNREIAEKFCNEFFEAKSFNSTYMERQA